MGITLTEVRFFLAGKCLLTLCIQFSFLSPAMAEPSASQPASLEATIDTLDRLLMERVENSNFGESDAPLLENDPQFPAIDWSSRKRLADGPISRSFRTLIFYAVCKEKVRAVSKLAAIRERFGGGFFTGIEIQYLNDLAKKRALSLRFRVDFITEQQDLSSINRARRISAALQNGDFKTALRLIPRFHSLCNLKPDHHAKQSPGFRMDQ